MRQICKTCRFYSFRGVDDGHVCTNCESDVFGDWVGEQYTCKVWKPEIEDDGFITSDSDVYERLKADVNRSWLNTVKCSKCMYSMDKDNRLYCWMHNKNVEPDYWCSYGGK